MSMFLPENTKQSQSSGVSSITPANPETTADDIALMQRVLSAASRNPNLIPSDFMAYFLDFIQTNNLIIPIGQIFGFSQFTAKYATIPAAEVTNSLVFVDLATVGPSLAGLPSGQYVFLFGAVANTTGGGAAAIMGLSVDGGAAADSTYTGALAGTPIMTALIQTLTGGAHTVTAKYRNNVGGQTASFASRWLIALKFANV